MSDPDPIIGEEYNFTYRGIPFTGTLIKIIGEDRKAAVLKTSAGDTLTIPLLELGD